MRSYILVLDPLYGIYAFALLLNPPTIPTRSPPHVPCISRPSKSNNPQHPIIIHTRMHPSIHPSIHPSTCPYVISFKENAIARIKGDLMISLSRVRQEIYLPLLFDSFIPKCKSTTLTMTSDIRLIVHPTSCKANYVHLFSEI